MMIDTNVCIAAMIRHHPHYLPSKQLLLKRSKRASPLMLSAHTLAEFYSAVTAIPSNPPIHPEEVEIMMEKNILPNFELVTLTVKDYQRAIKRCASKNLRSGIVYDALLIQAALKAKCEHLVTWNLKHFERLAGAELRIMSPADALALH